MSLPPQLETDLQTLREMGYKVEALRQPVSGNQIFVIFENYPLPHGGNFGNRWKNAEITHAGKEAGAQI